MQFAEIVPNMARELHRFGLLRSWNPENGSHGHADQWALSGRRFNPSVHYPTYGSVVSWQKGFVRPFLRMSSSEARSTAGSAEAGAGILGLQHNSFEMLADPNAAQFTVRDITPNGMKSERIDRRRKMLTAVDDLRARLSCSRKPSTCWTNITRRPST